MTGWVYGKGQNGMVRSKEGKILELRAMRDWVGVLHRAEWEGWKEPFKLSEGSSRSIGGF